MQLIRSRAMFLLTVLILMAVYNVVAFVIPFPRAGGFWSGYAFAMLAIALAATVGFFAFQRDTSLKSKVFGAPLASVAWRFLFVQLAASFAQKALDFAEVPFHYGLAANAIILGIFLVGLISANAVREEIEGQDAAVGEKVFFIKSMQAAVESLASKAPDEPARKALTERNRQCRLLK